MQGYSEIFHTGRYYGDDLNSKNAACASKNSPFAGLCLILLQENSSVLFHIFILYVFFVLFFYSIISRTTVCFVSKNPIVSYPKTLLSHNRSLFVSTHSRVSNNRLFILLQYKPYRLTTNNTFSVVVQTIKSNNKSLFVGRVYRDSRFWKVATIYQQSMTTSHCLSVE